MAPVVIPALQSSVNNNGLLWETIVGHQLDCRKYKNMHKYKKHAQIQIHAQMQIHEEMQAQKQNDGPLVEGRCLLLEQGKLFESGEKSARFPGIQVSCDE